MNYISAFLIFLSVMFIITHIRNNELFGFGINDKLYPTDSIQFIKKNNLPKNLFNPYGWGGYIIWKLYPQYKVFIDGRTPSLYTDNFFWIYRMAEKANPNIWEKLIKKYNINTVITKNKEVAKLLIRNFSFNLVGIDRSSFLLSKTNKVKSIQYYEILLSNNPLNILQRYKHHIDKILKELFYLKRFFPNNTYIIVLLGQIFLDIKQDPKTALRFFIEASKIDPHNANIYYNIGLCFQKLQKINQAIKFYKLSLKYNKLHKKSLEALSIIYFNRKQYSNSIKYITKVLDNFGEPTLNLIYYIAGVTYLYNLDFKRSCLYLERYLWSEEKADWKTLFYLGECNLALENYGKAYKFYKLALKLNPEDAYLKLQLYKIKHILLETTEKQE